MEWDTQRHEDIEGATKGELHHFESQYVNNKNPIQMWDFFFFLGIHKYTIN